MKKIFTILLLLSLVFQPTLAIAATNGTETTLNDYLSYFYNRYSKNFDKFGLVYSVPDYGIKKFTKPYYPREIISLASYYKYRAITNDLVAQKILKTGIEKTTRHFNGEFKHAPSFEDAEALVLLVSISQQTPTLFDTTTKDNLNTLIKNQLDPGILAPDTENRAIISAAHWQYLLNYLSENKLIDEANKEYYNQLIKEKIDKAIKESISNDGWYRETNIVPHYQAVSAFMLLIYGKISNQEEYLNLTKKMYFNLKILSCNNGQVESQIGHRPVGLGAQFYLMMGAMGNFFSDPDYNTYLTYASGNKFFSDPKRPNRLEYHSTTNKLIGKKTIYTAPNYHDDYAFTDVAELIISNNIFNKSKKILQKTIIQTPLNYKDDSDVSITRKNNIILLKDKKTHQQITVYCRATKNLIKKERN